MEEMIARLSGYGCDPEALSSHAGALGELCRVLDGRQGAVDDLDWEAEPRAPRDREEVRAYAENAARMTHYAAKLIRHAESAERVMGFIPSDEPSGYGPDGDPLVRPSQARVGEDPIPAARGVHRPADIEKMSERAHTEAAHEITKFCEQNNVGVDVATELAEGFAAYRVSVPNGTIHDFLAPC